LGDIYEICTQLTERVETLSVKVEKKRNLVAHQRDPNNGLHNHRRENTLEEFGYAAFGNPDAVMDENEELTLPALKETGPEEMRRRTDRLWQAMHAANVRYSLLNRHGCLSVAIFLILYIHPFCLSLSR